MARQGLTLPVVPTPFLDGVIDFESMERIIQHVCTDLDGYTLNGSTGESVSMTREERMAVAEFALRNTPKDCKVVVGITATSAGEALTLADHAASHGAAAVLLPAPYYFANTLGGVLRFLQVIDRKVQIPIVFYDNPYTTQICFSGPELRTLAGEVENLRYVKVTDHNIQKIAWLKQHTDLQVLAGDDVVLFRSLLLGCDGAMVLAPVLFPQAYSQMWEILQRGDQSGAFAIFSRRILPLLHVLDLGAELVATKELLVRTGIFRSAEVRPPLTPCDPAWAEQLQMAYAYCLSA